MCPQDNTFWENLSDDEIMTIPPHVAVHAMRTAAQNGAQVVSPRQVPSPYMLGRTHRVASQPFLHSVACESDNRYVWPVPDGHPPVDPRYVEERVVTKRGAPLSRRSPAQSVPITYATSKISNPIHKALLKIKANVDFQNREDVRGDPEQLAKLYARAWGQADDFFGKLSTVTLAHLTDLRSHAISADSAFARYLGPIHDRRVVSVAVGPSNTSAFGPDFAVDWNCMRVCAEAKFTMTVNSEGYSLREVSIPMPIGTYPPTSRPLSSMVFHPNPGIAWCHGARTFQIRCTGDIPTARIPNVVSAELDMGARTADVRDVLRLYDAAVRWTTTQITGASVSENALAGSITLLSRAVSTTTSTGRTAAAAIRQILMEALNSAPIDAKRTLTRSIAAMSEVLRAYMRETTDRTVVLHCCKYLAVKFQTLDGSINVKMMQVALSRREDYERWFMTLLNMAPRTWRSELTMGGFGWTILAMYYTFVPPDNKWRGYASSIRSSGIEAMSDPRTPIPSIPPTDIPNITDVVALRCATVAKSKGDMYGSSYMGVANACFVLASAWYSMSYDDVGKLLKVSGALWTFRSRCAEDVRVVVVDQRTVVPVHARYADVDFGEPLGRKRVIATTAPYAHYSALVKGLKNIGLLADYSMPEALVGRVSDELAKFGNLIDVAEHLDFETVGVRNVLYYSPLLKYARDPTVLSKDLEQFLDYAIEDAAEATRSAIREMSANALQRERDARAAEEEMRVNRDNARQAADAIISASAAEEAVAGEVADGATGWDYIYLADAAAAEEIMDAYETGDLDAIEILDGRYADENAFYTRVAARYRTGRTAATAANALL